MSALGRQAARRWAYPRRPPGRAPPGFGAPLGAPPIAELPRLPVGEVALQRRGPVRKRRSVGRVKRAHRPVLQPAQLAQVLRHVPFGRVDEDGAHARHHVPHHRGAARLVDETQVSAGMPRSVQHAPVHVRRSFQGDHFAVGEDAGHLDVEAVRGARVAPNRKAETRHQRCDAAHMVQVVVGEKWRTPEARCVRAR